MVILFCYAAQVLIASGNKSPIMILRLNLVGGQNATISSSCSNNYKPAYFVDRGSYLRNLVYVIYGLSLNG